ncbi:cold-shock protein [Shewanella sp. YIC-542]|uniref:cold-shock protein n=1 Tax=Shewanella mytili TaxID=3377111 RepID=UPI00398F5EE3
MKGKIVSYVSSKKFGFINGDDGESYFLHVSALVDKNAESKLLKDVVVEFDPMPTPKGLSAKQVVIPEVYIRDRLVDFFATKDRSPRHGNVVLRLPIATRFFKDPAEGRTYIEELAKKCGCNAVLGVSFEKNTFSNGNYRYTVHAFKGELALVTDKVPCDSRDMVVSSERLLSKRIDDAKQAFQPINEAEMLARKKQLSGCLGGCLGLFAFMMLLPVGLVSGIYNFWLS